MQQIVYRTLANVQDFSVLDFLTLSTKVFGYCLLCPMQFPHLETCTVFPLGCRCSLIVVSLASLSIF